MSTDNSIRDHRKTLRVQSLLSLLTLAIGVALMIFMMYTESEPGAIPLLLIVLGIGWFLVTRIRVRSNHK